MRVNEIEGQDMTGQSSSNEGANINKQSSVGRRPFKKVQRKRIM